MAATYSPATRSKPWPRIYLDDLHAGGMNVNEETTRICSTRTALSEMLEAASRKLERALRRAPAAESGNPQSGLDQVRASIADLAARLANHRSVHGC
jgi:hypothetical protein